MNTWIDLFRKCIDKFNIATYRQILASNRQLARKSENCNLPTAHSAEGYCTFFFPLGYLTIKLTKCQVYNE